MKRLRYRLLFLGILSAQLAFADVRLPQVFGSNMVLQRRKPVPVWGWADSGETVTVRLNNRNKTTKAAKDGTWRVNLDPMEAGGPYQMVVTGKKNTITFDNVLLGEVWVCSGQSNMEWPLIAATNGPQEVAAANFPQIRQLLVEKAISLTPKDDIKGQWTVCTPETAPNYTAVGYFFARKLQQELNVPIGLIHTSWGGTHSETWTSREAMTSDPELAKAVATMPTSLDEMRRSGQERINKLVQQTQGALPTATEALRWAAPETDTQSWKTMTMPGDWEWRGLPVFDGVVWYRREVMVPDDANLKNATLRFGAIDDADSTYVNGLLVGSTDGYNLARSYALPKGLVKPGRNVIAVRIKDTGGGGGFMGDPEQMKLAFGKDELPLAGPWQYRIERVYESSYGAGPNTYATLLFNAMLHPLIPYAMAGTIWYQGESNAGRAYQYRRAFPLLIQDWRKRWGQDFPFLFVQLASYAASNGDSRKGSNWAELREAQTLTLQLPNTGMAVASDIGESNDIHPRNKQDVGLRLAAEAMRVAYATADNGTNDASHGPMFEKMLLDGNRAVITLRHTGSGLMVKDKYGYLKGFEVAGADGVFHYAKADIQGNNVVVYADAVAAPVAVRYGWADDNGDVNLYNREGFPAVPFRTDTWKGITEEGKF